MNELELENDLRKLRPAPASRALEDAIARDLAECTIEFEPAPRQRVATRLSAVREESHVSPFWMWLDRFLWSGLGASVAAVAVVLVHQSRPAPAITEAKVNSPATVAAPVSGVSLQPVLASEEDQGWRDEGVRFDSQGRPMLKLSRTAVERQAWADFQNSGVIQVERPREEVMWVPVPVH